MFILWMRALRVARDGITARGCVTARPSSSLLPTPKFLDLPFRVCWGTRVVRLVGFCARFWDRG